MTAGRGQIERGMSTQITIIILACIIAFCYLVTMFYNYKWNKEKSDILNKINELYWKIDSETERVNSNTKQSILGLKDWMKSEFI